jgi:hypothetical protein
MSVIRVQREPGGFGAAGGLKKSLPQPRLVALFPNVSARYWWMTQLSG